MLRIRIRIRIRRISMFVGLLASSKNSKKNLHSYCFVTSFWLFLSLKNDVNIPAKSNKRKNCFLASLRSMTKKAGSGSESGSTSQRYESADPDPHQNVIEPQRWFGRIQMGQWIWSRIHDTDLDPRRPKRPPKTRKKWEVPFFEGLDVLYTEAEA